MKYRNTNSTSKSTHTHTHTHTRAQQKARADLKHQHHLKQLTTTTFPCITFPWYSDSESIANRILRTANGYWTIKLGLIMACLCISLYFYLHVSSFSYFYIYYISIFLISCTKSIQKLTCRPGPGGPSPQAPSNRSARRRAACAPDNARSNGHET